MNVAMFAVVMVRLMSLKSIKCTVLNELFLKSIYYFTGVFIQYPLCVKTFSNFVSLPNLDLVKVFCLHNITKTYPIYSHFHSLSLNLTSHRRL